ncbi:hypothetical protein Pst134EA_032223 [Puccinia striiformis f. sp. tritici]|uniref:uncharacterized protein n=1 Tax=Puccinia striiformis f. sp. tritici TaxID=168172 RepID=UPI002008535F|nr:uncharacterized protein Pst134EA_032223 [Puccinia striiformis f. sp. tritici]KAH9444348.1 hypothetical protein Pst134EA_032223 [Puccinia striiformis f. sp. tritici]
MLTFLLTLSICYFLLQIPSVGCDSKIYESLNPISNVDERQCERWESPSMGDVSNPNRCQKEDDSWPPTSKMEPFKNGFFKSNCSRHPLDNEPGPYCIFLNPSLNKGMGMVIISKESFFVASLKNLDFSEEENESCCNFPTDQTLWWTEFGLEESKDEFIASILKQNSFSTYLNPESQILHSALVLEPPVRFNHDCRPNVGYRMDHVTQTLHMVAFREIAAGEELTISHRSSELTRKDIHYAGEEWLAISEVKELIRICQKENLPYSLINSHFIVAQVYNAHGRTKKAIYYAKKAQRDGSIFVGPKWLYSEDAQLLSSNLKIITLIQMDLRTIYKSVKGKVSMVWIILKYFPRL